MPGPGVVDTTTTQNIVTAINGLITNYLSLQGQSAELDISTATLVKQGAGRVVVVSITTAGSSDGAIYDGNAASVTTGKLYTIPNTIGVVVLNMPVSLGIVVAPGSGQVVSVSYS